MTHAPNVPRSPRWDQHAPAPADYTADDLRHLREHLETYLHAHHNDTDLSTLSVTTLIDTMRVRQATRRDAELEREESMVPPVRELSLEFGGKGTARNADIAGWVWYETEYPEHGSIGPFATRKLAEVAADESDCVDWTVAPITRAQLREREMEGEIEAMADADVNAEAAIAAIDTLARAEAEGAGPEVRASAARAIEEALSHYPIHLRREHVVWEMYRVGNYDYAKVRVRKLALAAARAYVTRQTAQASGEISDGR